MKKKFDKINLLEYIFLKSVLVEAESCEENIPLPPGCYSVLSKVATVLNIFHQACKEDKNDSDNFRYFYDP